MGRPRRKLEIKVGEKFRWYDRDLWYIIGIIDDGGQELIALKSWARLRSKWVYKLETRESMEYWFDAYNKEGIGTK